MHPMGHPPEGAWLTGPGTSGASGRLAPALPKKYLFFGVVIWALRAQAPALFYSDVLE